METFKKDLLSLSDPEMVNKYYLSGADFVFDEEKGSGLRLTYLFNFLLLPEGWRDRESFWFLVSGFWFKGRLKNRDCS